MELKEAQDIILKHSGSIKEGYSATVTDWNGRSGQFRVEIRDYYNTLVWRAWNFEPEFRSDLIKNLKGVTK